MTQDEHKQLFYIVDEDEENYPFYGWLRVKYEGANRKLIYHGSFNDKHIEKVYPRSKVSLFIISFSEINHRNIKNFLKQNPRFDLPFVLYVGREKEVEEEATIPWMYIGESFKNGIKITKHDYVRYTENFIETVIIAEEDFKRCFKNVRDRLVFHSVKIETKDSLHFFREFQKFFRENYKLMEETTPPEIDIEPLIPSLDRFEVELPQTETPMFIKRSPEDYFEIIEEEFDIKTYIETLIGRIKDFLYEQYKSIKKIWVREKEKLWKKHNEELSQKINNQSDRFKTFLKETKKLKYLRLKVYETLHEIEESEKNLSLTERQLFPESSFKNLLKDNFHELKQRIEKLFKYKRWKLYLIATLSTSLVFSLPLSIFILKHYGLLYKFVTFFVSSFIMFFLLFRLLRQLLIQKQYGKVNLLLKESAENLNEKIKENLKRFNNSVMDEILRKQILKRDHQFLINMYRDILGILDNYIYVFRHFGEFLLTMSQDTPILIGAETPIEQKVEIPEKELVEILGMLPFALSRSILYDRLYNIMLNTYKGYVADAKLEGNELEDRLNKAIKRFWEYFPSKRNDFYPVSGVIVSPLKESFGFIPTQLENVLEGTLVESYDGVLIASLWKRR